jgi:hypothetical protein
LPRNSRGAPVRAAPPLIGAPALPLRIRKPAILLLALPLTLPALAGPGCWARSGSDQAAALGRSVGRFSPRIAVEWMNLVYFRVRAQACSPLIASRVYGYAGVAPYEAAVHGMPGYRGLAGRLLDLGPLPRPDRRFFHDWPAVFYDWPAAIHYAMASVLPGIFPSASADRLNAFLALQADWDSRRSGRVSAETFARSCAFGQLAGPAILEWAAGDG